MDTVVLKFGGAAVAAPEKFSQIAQLILGRRDQFDRIVIVVSAMGNTTNELIELAHKVNPWPPQRELDMLVSVGERISISLLAMALEGKGVEAVSFTGSQSGIVTTNAHSDGRIIEIRPHRLLKAFDAGKIVIVAGFQGCSQHGEITTLGRGGSDTTAVALGVALNADRVEFFKDVGGIFDSDPKNQPSAIRHEQLTFDEALLIAGEGARVLSPRAIELAKKNQLPLWVYPIDGEISVPGTIVGPKERDRAVAHTLELGDERLAILG